MKVLFVIPIFSSGGIERMVLTWIKALKKYNIECEVLAFKNGESKEFLSENIVTYTIDNMSINIVNSRKILKKFFEEHSDYDAVHSNVSYFNGLISDVVKNTLGIKCVTVSHAHLNAANKCSSIASLIVNSTIRKYMKFKINKYSNYNLACSYDSGNLLFGESKFDFFPNAIETDLFEYNLSVRNEYRNQYNLNGKYCILHVGRFSHEKNHIFLIEVFKELVKTNKNAELYLLGVGDLQEYIKEIVHSEGLSNKVHFLGFRTDTNNFYNAADVLILPSLIEGFPVSLVEAQSAGLKIVASTASPPESAITDLVSLVDLKDPIDNWIKLIMKNNNNYDRLSYNKQVDDAGFNIVSQVNHLIKLYGSLK